VIWRIKSAKTDKPATKQNDHRAGTAVSIPMKKAKPSQRAAVKIEGKIYFLEKATLSSMSVIWAGTLLSALEIKNMLSTPMARTKKGTTSAEIIVKGTKP
jgi:hypothetical protein